MNLWIILQTAPHRQQTRPGMMIAYTARAPAPSSSRLSLLVGMNVTSHLGLHGIARRHGFHGPSALVLVLVFVFPGFGWVPTNNFSLCVLFLSSHLHRSPLPPPFVFFFFFFLSLQFLSFFSFHSLHPFIVLFFSVFSLFFLFDFKSENTRG